MSIKATLIVTACIFCLGSVFANAQDSTTEAEAEPTLGQMLDSAIEKSKDLVEQGVDASKDAWDATKEVSSEAWDKTKEVSGETWDKTKELTGEAVDATKEQSAKIGEAAKSGYDAAKQSYQGTDEAAEAAASD